MAIHSSNKALFANRTKIIATAFLLFGIVSVGECIHAQQNVVSELRSKAKEDKINKDKIIRMLEKLKSKCLKADKERGDKEKTQTSYKNLNEVSDQHLTDARGHSISKDTDDYVASQLSDGERRHLEDIWAFVDESVRLQNSSSNDNILRDKITDFVTDINVEDMNPGNMNKLIVIRELSHVSTTIQSSAKSKCKSVFNDKVKEYLKELEIEKVDITVLKKLRDIEYFIESADRYFEHFKRKSDKNDLISKLSSYTIDTMNTENANKLNAEVIKDDEKSSACAKNNKTEESGIAGARLEQDEKIVSELRIESVNDEIFSDVVAKYIDSLPQKLKTSDRRIATNIIECLKVSKKMQNVTNIPEDIRKSVLNYLKNLTLEQLNDKQKDTLEGLLDKLRVVEKLYDMYSKHKDLLEAPVTTYLSTTNIMYDRWGLWQMKCAKKTVKTMVEIVDILDKNSGSALKSTIYNQFSRINIDQNKYDSYYTRRIKSIVALSNKLQAKVQNDKILNKVVIEYLGTLRFEQLKDRNVKQQIKKIIDLADKSAKLQLSCKNDNKHITEDGVKKYILDEFYEIIESQSKQCCSYYYWW